MNPIQARRFFDPEKIDRKFMCRHYNGCLDRAVERGWSGFACLKCRDFDLEGRHDPAYWQEQDRRAAQLLFEAAVLS
jgi:hypothetical protein